MNRIIIIVAACFITLAACKPNNANVWTKEYEEKQYKDIYKSLEVAIKDPQQRKLFTTYIIKNFKQKLPHGLESIPADSLRKMSFDLGKEYTYNGHLHGGLAWTALNEQSFRTGLDKEIAKKIPDEKIRGPYCDCFVAKIKQTYPDSLILPIPDSVMVAIAKSCLKK